jgi:uncharacterized protein YndB with AHSA1/START domain
MSRVRVEIDQVIAGPVERVFAQATDLAGFSGWMPGGGIFKECTGISDGPVRLGTTYVDRGRMGAFRGEVVEFERPSRVLYQEILRRRGRPMVEARMTYAFSPSGRGTLVHHVGESELHGIYRLMGPLAGVVARRERRRTVNALKAAVEASGGAGAAARAA